MAFAFTHTQQSSVLVTNHTNKYWLVLDSRITTIPNEFWAAVADGAGRDIRLWNSDRSVEYDRIVVNIDTGTKKIQMWGVLGNISDAADAVFTITVGGDIVAFTASPYDAHWCLEDLTDISSNGNTLTNVHSTPFESGHIENAPHFDGINDNLYTATIPSANREVGTLKYDFYKDVDNSSGDMPINFGIWGADVNTNLFCYPSGSDNFEIVLNINGVQSWRYQSIGWMTGKFAQWNRAVLSQNGSAPILILNGVSQTLTPVTTASPGDWIADAQASVNPFDRFTIGARSRNGGIQTQWDGLVDTVQLIPDAWTANEAIDHDANENDPDVFWVSSNWRNLDAGGGGVVCRGIGRGILRGAR